MALERLEPLEGVEVVLVEEVDPQSCARQRRHDLPERVLELDAAGVLKRGAAGIGKRPDAGGRLPAGAVRARAGLLRTFSAGPASGWV
jgi:hypothetical protein